MFISVLFKNNRYGVIKRTLIEGFIISGEITKFFRSSGWVTIGLDPTRKVDHSYLKERRKPEPRSYCRWAKNVQTMTISAFWISYRVPETPRDINTGSDPFSGPPTGYWLISPCKVSVVDCLNPIHSMEIFMHYIKRSDERFTFISNGQMDINGTKYKCLVDNISTIGAMIKVTDSEHKHIQIGEMCTLDFLLLSPVKYLCKVVRINLNQIGLQFVGNWISVYSRKSSSHIILCVTSRTAGLVGQFAIKTQAVAPGT